ncbi:MAG: YicC/YloC family endoribonuclease [Planctomycetia bacterium]|nr:YicC/YloC family endoribonuclease [Planctomycetia bacterium]
MLLSMTGFGSASCRDLGYVVSAEVKSVNNRYLKTSIRLPEGLTAFESKIDELIRGSIARGTVNLTVKLERETSDQHVCINESALLEYLAVARRVRESSDLARETPLGDMVDYLRLPGVIQDHSAEDNTDPEALWTLVANCVQQTLDALREMRRVEGDSTEKYLLENLALLRQCNDRVKELAPKVVENYREKTYERVSNALKSAGVTLDPKDLIREVAIFTDKVDISEEISRLYSHLTQFKAVMTSETACGKKLDFLTQEMFRETNTIGSKANSPDIADLVVEMKATVERIREMVQNVE